MSTLDLQGENLTDVMGRGKRDRVIHIYVVPPSLAKPHGVEKIGIVELNAEEEINATKRAAGDGLRIGFELAKESLREVNGQAVNTNDGTADRAWNTMHPKIRMLCVTAYTDIHQPAKEDHAAFIGSRQAQVG